MEAITFNQLVGLAAAMMILIGVYNTIMTATKNRREEKKWRDAPIDSLKNRVDAHDEMLARDKKSIDEMRERIDAMGEQSTIMLRGIRALLSHEINGNSTDKLRDSMSEMDDYLISRK